MGKLAERMKEDLLLRNYSAVTAKAYVRVAREFVAFYRRPPTELGEDEIRAFLSHQIVERKLSPNGMRKYVGGIKFLYRVTLGNADLAKRIPYPRHPRHLPLVPSPEQVAALLAKAEGDLQLTTMIMLGYGAGLRISEACQLRHEDIDSKRGVLYVRAGKGNKDRVTLLSPRLLAKLREWWRVRRPDGPYVFPGTKEGRPITMAAPTHAVARVRDEAGLPEWFTFHKLRHAFATHLLESGVDILTISSLLGHSQLKTTLVYLRIRTAHIREVTSPLERLDLE